MCTYVHIQQRHSRLPLARNSKSNEKALASHFSQPFLKEQATTKMSTTATKEKSKETVKANELTETHAIGALGSMPPSVDEKEEATMTTNKECNDCTAPSVTNNLFPPPVKQNLSPAPAADARETLLQGLGITALAKNDVVKEETEDSRDDNDKNSRYDYNSTKSPHRCQARNNNDNDKDAIIDSLTQQLEEERKEKETIKKKFEDHQVESATKVKELEKEVEHQKLNVEGLLEEQVTHQEELSEKDEALADMNSSNAELKSKVESLENEKRETDKTKFIYEVMIRMRFATQLLVAAKMKDDDDKKKFKSDGQFGKMCNALNDDSSLVDWDECEYTEEEVMTMQLDFSTISTDRLPLGHPIDDLEDRAFFIKTFDEALAAMTHLPEACKNKLRQKQDEVHSLILKEIRKRRNRQAGGETVDSASPQVLLDAELPTRRSQPRTPASNTPSHASTRASSTTSGHKRGRNSDLRQTTSSAKRDRRHRSTSRTREEGKALSFQVDDGTHSINYNQNSSHGGCDQRKNGRGGRRKSNDRGDKR